MLINIKGMAALTVSSNVTPAMGLVTKRTIPKGGVDSPITKLTHMMTPMWIGSMPNTQAIGASIGPIIMTEA